MSHMQAQIQGPSEWWEVETTNGTHWVPCRLVGYQGLTAESFKDYVDGGDITEWERKLGYGVRLSAPGYTDCTDWCVFDSEDEARAYIADLHDLCPICLGDDWAEGSEQEGTSCVPCTVSITSEEFQDAMDGVVSGMVVHEIVSMPGVHEIVSEELNNEIVQAAYDQKVTEHETRKRPCGSCENCRELEKVRERLLACANPPFSHADDDIVKVWNTELERLQCSRLRGQ